ncbi:GH11353 [Drosophila grimshawi]|uniref:GH11353 n=2 Tax=Drosophila grimshawi TaxID=7222 RepID=B4JEE0_DROGR|nr:GH11353 [Drosophila grimshawi]
MVGVYKVQQSVWLGTFSSILSTDYPTNMKTSFILLCLALYVAAVFADCDPDGNGMPSCSGSDNSKYRNFWDPTHYWVCQGGSAVSVACEIIGGFDQATSQCITWDKWTWVPPCPAT